MPASVPNLSAAAVLHLFAEQLALLRTPAVLLGAFASQDPVPFQARLDGFNRPGATSISTETQTPGWRVRVHLFSRDARASFLKTAPSVNLNGIRVCGASSHQSLPCEPGGVHPVITAFARSRATGGLVTRELVLENR
jgi:hypothetical protein